MPKPYSFLSRALGLVASVFLFLGTAAAQPSATVPYTAVAGSDDGGFSMALRADGSLWAWGSNTFGELGIGQTGAPRTTPVLVPHPATAAPGTTWTKVALGWLCTMALRSDNTLWAWGDNRYGALGNGTTANRSTPGLVPTPTGAAAGSTWTEVASSPTHVMALRSDGTLWAWGHNLKGELGDGTFTDRLLPVRIPTPAGTAPGSSWVQISCGFQFTLALRSDGTLWGWGYNPYNQLGHGISAGTFDPVPPTLIPTPPGAAAGTSWIRIGTGHSSTVALRSDNTLWRWGNGNVWNPHQIPVPATAAAGTTWTDFTAGHVFWAALLSDGTLWSANANDKGQLGINNTVFQYTPQQEFTQSLWNHLGAGLTHLLAIDSQGMIYGTGENTSGQLGDGTTTNRLIFGRSLAPVLAATPPRTLPAPQPSPNPAHDFLRLPGLPATATLRLHDTQGRLVREARPVAGTLDVRGLAPGLYLLTVQEPSQASRAARVVLE